MAPTVEPIGKPVTLGEAPFWDADSQSLYFVDIEEGTIHKYNHQTKKQFSAKPGKETNYNCTTNFNIINIS